MTRKGHIAVECKGLAKPRRCYRCATEGHFVRDCAVLDKGQTLERKESNTKKNGKEVILKGKIIMIINL